jgi:hypothetical protein
MKPKNAYLFLVILLGFQGFVTAQSNPSKYVGYKYTGVVPNKTLPNGVKHLGGGLIGDINADPVYGISQVVKGKTTMLWLEVSTGQNATGVTGWLVKDVLAFNNLTKNQHLFSAADPAVFCQRDKKDVENLIAVGKIFARQGIFKPTRVWIADLKTQRFEPMSIKGLKCEYSEP